MTATVTHGPWSRREARAARQGRPVIPLGVGGQGGPPPRISTSLRIRPVGKGEIGLRSRRSDRPRYRGPTRAGSERVSLFQPGDAAGGRMHTPKSPRRSRLAGRAASARIVQRPSSRTPEIAGNSNPGPASPGRHGVLSLPRGNQRPLALSTRPASPRCPTLRRGRSLGVTNSRGHRDREALESGLAGPWARSWVRGDPTGRDDR